MTSHHAGREMTPSDAHLAWRNEVKAIDAHVRSGRVPNTSQAYEAKQKEYLAWCDSQASFDASTKDTATEEKLYAFVHEICT